MMLISVDLPAPFSPNSTCTSPRRRSKSTPSSATTPGNRFEILESSRRRSLVSRAASAARDSLLSATAAIWATVSHAFDQSRRLHGIDGLEVGRRKHETHVDLVNVALGDHVGDSLRALDVVLLFQNADGRVDRDAALHHRILRGEAEDLALVEGIEHRLVLVGGHDQHVLLAGLRDGADRSFRGRSAAPDHVHVRISLQRILVKPSFPATPEAPDLSSSILTLLLPLTAFLKPSRKASAQPDPDGPGKVPTLAFLPFR